MVRELRRARAFADERLAAGATELRDMIYSAWVKSAEPRAAFEVGGLVWLFFGLCRGCEEWVLMVLDSR